MESGDHANVSRLDCDIHTGTHIDAPKHFLQDGDTIDHVRLDTLVGPASVIELSSMKTIIAEDLENMTRNLRTRRLLIKTGNSRFWANGITEFQKDFTALTAEAAHWVVDRGIHLIGIDYLSVEPYGDLFLTHKILLKAGVVILEGLNLAAVQPGDYELICLPLKIVGAEGAPARAVLRNIAPSCEQQPEKD